MPYSYICICSQMGHDAEGGGGAAMSVEVTPGEKKLKEVFLGPPMTTAAQPTTEEEKEEEVSLPFTSRKPAVVFSL